MASASLSDLLFDRQRVRRQEDHLSEFIDYLRIERGATEHTISAYSSDLRRLVAFLEKGNHTLESATRDNLRAFLLWLHNAGLSPGGNARRFATVRSFYKFMRYTGQVPKNPTSGIRLPHYHHKLVENVPDADVEKMLAYLAGKDDPITLRNRAIIRTLYGSGLRVSELITLRLENLSFPALALNVIGKGNKQRNAPMNPPQAAALTDYLERGRPTLIRDCQEHNIVFVNSNSRSVKMPRGSPLTRQGVFAIVRQLGRDVLGRDIHPHQLRHSFGTTLIEHGADPRNVMALMGHSDIQTTMRYMHIDLRTIKEVHQRTHPRG